MLEYFAMVRLQDEIKKYVNKYRDLGPVYCPALAAEVHFTLKGWKHVLGRESGQTRRSEKEILSRLDILPEVQAYLKKAHKVDQFRRQNGVDFYGFRFHSPGRDRIIRIVVSRDQSNLYRFYSVFLEYKKE